MSSHAARRGILLAIVMIVVSLVPSGTARAGTCWRPPVAARGSRAVPRTGLPVVSGSSWDRVRHRARNCRPRSRDRPRHVRRNGRRHRLRRGSPRRRSTSDLRQRLQQCDRGRRTRGPRGANRFDRRGPPLRRPARRSIRRSCAADRHADVLAPVDPDRRRRAGRRPTAPAALSWRAVASPGRKPVPAGYNR